MNKNILFGAIVALTLSGQSFADEADLLSFARKSATLAGGAQYCKADEDMIDEFIAKAEARLAFLASDEYEKVLGKLEFKNVLAGAAAREPQGGCEAFVKNFEESVRQSR